MASFERRGTKWRASVYVAGTRKTGTFATKAAAKEWAMKTEIALHEQPAMVGKIPNKTFKELLDRYIDEVSVKKKGERWERLRLQLIGRMTIGETPLPKLDASHVAQWRDERLQQISAPSVAREWSMLNHACTIAVKEWKWLKTNPFAEIKRPSKGKPRERRITQNEIDRIILASGFEEDRQPSTSTAKTGVAFLFAIETAMRMGEIAGLTWENVNFDKRTAFLPDTKNGTSRTVPLSTRATHLLEILPKTGSRCFDMETQSMEALFRKLKARAMIKDLHFHDTRHEAISRLAKKLEVLELARVVGHRDLRSLMVYYNPTAEELVSKLD